MRNFMLSLTCLLTINSFAQNVGIGTTTPNATAQLHVDVGSSNTKGLLVSGTYTAVGTVPDLGTSYRLMFYPGKGAFRAGYVTGTQWNNANTGILSTALGTNTTASSTFTTALGYNTTASSPNAMAMGEATTASGPNSTAMGQSTTASGANSTAMGYGTTASGYYSTAMGYGTTAGGYYSTAIGHGSNASGYLSFAIGYNANASGNYSTALGYGVNTNGNTGSFIIGDTDPNGEGFTYSGYPNEFVARFWNGYYFMTSGNSSRFGVYVGHYGNSWLSICDVNRKENFEPLDGEDVLQKLSKINFTSWNYKQQDPKIYRHYGIMAQDFYAAFGHDRFGTIGNDTMVNPIDMIGIDMTAIQALEKRTQEIRGENERLKTENAALKTEVAEINNRLKKLEEILKKN